jgi:hypothetical protein
VGRRKRRSGWVERKGKKELEGPKEQKDEMEIMTGRKDRTNEVKETEKWKEVANEGGNGYQNTVPLTALVPQVLPAHWPRYEGGGGNRMRRGLVVTMETNRRQRQWYGALMLVWERSWWRRCRGEIDTVGVGGEVVCQWR